MLLCVSLTMELLSMVASKRDNGLYGSTFDDNVYIIKVGEHYLKF